MIYEYKCKKCNKKKELNMTLEKYIQSKPPKCCEEDMIRLYDSQGLIGKENGGQFNWKK